MAKEIKILSKKNSNPNIFMQPHGIIKHLIFQT